MMNLLEIYIIGVFVSYCIYPFLVLIIGHSYMKRLKISDHHLPAWLWFISVPFFFYLLIFGNKGNDL